MKITKITVKNYRSCTDVAFSPHENLSVLIGPNGSGKTNLLSAIRLLTALCYSRTRHFAGGEPTTSPCELRVVYDVDGSAVTHSALLNLVTNERNRDEIVSAQESWYMPSVTGNRKKINMPSSFLSEFFQERSVGGIRFRMRSHFIAIMEGRGISSQALPVLEKIVGFVTKLSYYAASQFTNPGNSPISFEVEGDAKRRTGISITGHKKFLFDVYEESRNNTDVYTEFIGLVGPEGIGLVESIKFDEIQTSSSSYSVMTGGKVVRKERINLLVVPSFKVAGNTLSPSQLSEGTFKTLALVFYLVSDKSAILMIEEPEVCVHHGLLNSIVELIKTYSKGKQILISTHSDAVLDKVDLKNVYKVWRAKDKGTQVMSVRKGMGAKELAALKEYLQNEGSLGEYWKHGDLETI